MAEKNGPSRAAGGNGHGQWSDKDSKKGQHMSHMTLEILNVLKRAFLGIQVRALAVWGNEAEN